MKEITGITDKTIIHEAIKACQNKEGKYEVAEVVSMLISDESPQSKAKPGTNKKVSLQLKNISHNRLKMLTYLVLFYNNNTIQ